MLPFIYKAISFVPHMETAYEHVNAQVNILPRKLHTECSNIATGTLRKIMVDYLAFYEQIQFSSYKVFGHWPK